jgi:hypothetical protein
MKRLLAYELMSLCFLAFTLYIIDGSLSQKDIEVLAMYAMFMAGSIGYVRPLLTQNYGRRNSDNTEIKGEPHVR